MNLEQYFNRRVRVIDKLGKAYVGVVDVFTYAKDNDVNEDAIAISGVGIWLDESDIQSIELIDN